MAQASRDYAEYLQQAQQNNENGMGAPGLPPSNYFVCQGGNNENSVASSGGLLANGATVDYSQHTNTMLLQEQ